jgi:large subunit ribosomal protein L35
MAKLKLKTKSSVKKRFRVSSTGKVMATMAGKQHGMRKRTKSQLRNLRSTTVMANEDARNVLKHFLPYSR